MKIYTRTGDGGTSGLYSGERLPKSDIRFDALGTLDELNAAVGMARALAPHEDVNSILRRAQELLFDAGADIATLHQAKARLGDEEISWLEREIDRMIAALPELRTFILPTGHPAAAALHTARSVCRRAERLVIALDGSPPTARIFLNRLSDFLFTAARFQNHLAGVAEDPWLPSR